MKKKIYKQKNKYISYLHCPLGGSGRKGVHTGISITGEGGPWYRCLQSMRNAGSSLTSALGFCNGKYNYCKIRRWNLQINFIKKKQLSKLNCVHAKFTKTLFLSYTIYKKCIWVQIPCLRFISAYYVNVEVFEIKICWNYMSTPITITSIRTQPTSTSTTLLPLSDVTRRSSNAFPLPTCRN